MIFNSSSSIRKDYWPGYNVIDNLNNQIQEVQNEVDLLNINVVSNDTSIRSDINNLKNQYNSGFVTGTLVANAANVNYYIGRVVNTDIFGANTAYIENLAVNKPILNATLNTPHIENITVVEGNLFNVNIDGLTYINVNNVNAKDINVESLEVTRPVNNLIINAPNIYNAAITRGNLFNVNIDGANFVNVNLPENFSNIFAGNITARNIEATDDVWSETLRSGDLLNIRPIRSAQAVGYDADGKLIPIHTTVDLNFEFPNDAVYLKTTPSGVLMAGIPASSVENTNHLLEASALYNFAGNIDNSLNSMNNAINNAGHSVPETDPVNWTNNFNFLVNNVNATVNYGNPINIINSTTPINYMAIDSVNWLAGPFDDGTYIGNAISMKIVDTELQFSGIPDITITTNVIYNTTISEGYLLYPLVNNNATNMFRNCTGLTSIDTTPFKDVTEANSMFYNCRSLSEIDTTPLVNVINAYTMLYDCIGLTEINTSGFNNVRHAGFMFYNCGGLTEINTEPFVNVNNAVNMFSKCAGLIEINTEPFTKVTSAISMFNGCNRIYSINTEPFTNVINANYMFANCNSLTSIDTLGFTNVTTASNMFYNCNGLASINTSGLINVTDASCMFAGCTGLTSIDTTPLTNVKMASYMFSSCKGLTSIDTAPLTNVTSATGMFSGCKGLTSVNISGLTNATTGSSMFLGCTSLTSIDTTPLTKITSASNMFNECTNLTTIDTSGLINVNNTMYMFNNCRKLNQDMYLYSAPTNIYKMFYGCTNLVGKNIHILSSIPLDTSNYVYNMLVNNGTGVNWTGRVYNDL